MRALSTLLLAVFLPVISNGQTLVASWQFNGNANDASGNNLNGIVYNATPTAGISGVANTAYQFDGMRSHIDVPYSALLNLTTWTIQTLVRVDGFNQNACQEENMFGRGTSYGYDSYGVGLSDNSHDNDCGIYSPNYTEFISGAGGTSSSNWHDANYIQLHQWYALTVTYNGSVVKQFLNGVAIDSVYWTNQYNYGSTQPPAVFGYDPNNSSNYSYWFNGAIDNLSIWSGALPDTAIYNFYHANIITMAYPVADTVICSGTTFILPYNIIKPFNTGNVFTAQLSDASGSFANPVNIGNLSSTSAGALSCTIPSATAAGTGYRVRIIASAPGDTSVDNGTNIHIYNSVQPTVTVTSNPLVYSPGVNMVFTANVVGGSNYTYQWQLNGLSLAGATTNTFSASTLHSGDKVTVVVTSSGPCGIDTVTSNVVSLGINGSLTTNSNFKVYPNPAQDEITIEGKGDNANLAVYDMAGKEVWAAPVTFKSGSARVSLSLPSGTYAIKLSNEQGVIYSDRLVILK